MQEKDDQINNLQKQLAELQHKIITMTEEINEMFEWMIYLVLKLNNN